MSNWEETPWQTPHADTTITSDLCVTHKPLEGQEEGGAMTRLYIDPGGALEHELEN